MTKGDHLAYRRAALVSMLGLVFQTALTILMFAYGKLTGDHAASSSVYLLGSGIILWGLLVLVFDQHRRERLEALEAEQLASSSAASSAFEATTDDLKVAARRLATIQKWVLPLGSLLIAGVNLVGGSLSLRAWRAVEEPVPPPATGWALAIGFGIAIVMFVFARFVSGMGTLKPWSNLRAGAAAAVAASIVGLLIGAGAFVQMALSQTWMALANPYIVSILMLVLGSETVLHLVLDLYRPRSAGEAPRPAFDSRLLGLIAAPDRIADSVGEALNYQFGVDITSSWFYQLLMRRLAVLVGLGVLVAWLLTAVVVVGPHQRGLVLSRGRVVEPLLSFGDVGASGDVGPGLHIKAPWPLATFEIPTIEARDGFSRSTEVATAGVRVLHLASSPPEDPTKPIVWTESHATAELLNIVQPGRIPSRLADLGEGAGGRGGSLSLLAVEVPVQYVVRDFKLFDEFAGPGQRERLLTAIGRRVVTQYLGQQTFDEVIATGRTTMPAELERRLTEAYGGLNDGKGPGIEILFVGVNGVHPPVKVAPNFERTVIARQNQESTIQTALKTKTQRLTEVAGSVDLADRIVGKLAELDAVRGSGTPEETELELEVQRLLEDAGGEAGQLLLEAGSSRWARHMSERGRAAMLQGQNLAYEAAPSLFRSKMYFDALLEAMRTARVYVTPRGLEDLHIRLELQDDDVGTPVFNENAGAELQM